jgi:hypothetical protein
VRARRKKIRGCGYWICAGCGVRIHDERDERRHPAGFLRDARCTLEMSYERSDLILFGPIRSGLASRYKIADVRPIITRTEDKS